VEVTHGGTHRKSSRIAPVTHLNSSSPSSDSHFVIVLIKSPIHPRTHSEHILEEIVLVNNFNLGPFYVVFLYMIAFRIFSYIFFVFNDLHDDLKFIG